MRARVTVRPSPLQQRQQQQLPPTFFKHIRGDQTRFTLDSVWHISPSRFCNPFVSDRRGFGICFFLPLVPRDPITRLRRGRATADGFQRTLLSPTVYSPYTLTHYSKICCNATTRRRKTNFFSRPVFFYLSGHKPINWSLILNRKKHYRATGKVDRLVTPGAHGRHTPHSSRTMCETVLGPVVHVHERYNGRGVGTTPRQQKHAI